MPLLMQQLVHEAPAIFCLADSESHKILYGNAKALRIFGDDIVGKTIGQISSDILRGSVDADERHEFSMNVQGVCYRVSRYPVNADGQSAIVFFGLDGGFYAHSEPCEDAKTEQDALRQLEQQVNQYRFGLAPFFSVCLVDVADRKAIYDMLGCQGRDEYVDTVQAVIKIAVRGTDTLISMGGGEFMILFPKCSAAVAERIMHTVEGRLEILSEENKLEIPLRVHFAAYEVNDIEKADTKTIVAALRQKITDTD
jgi:diguanylate cyclase (GGDEF)-like protein